MLLAKLLMAAHCSVQVTLPQPHILNPNCLWKFTSRTIKWSNLRPPSRIWVMACSKTRCELFRDIHGDKVKYWKIIGKIWNIFRVMNQPSECLLKRGCKPSGNQNGRFLPWNDLYLWQLDLWWRLDFSFYLLQIGNVHQIWPKQNYCWCQVQNNCKLVEKRVQSGIYVFLQNSSFHNSKAC